MICQNCGKYMSLWNTPRGEEWRCANCDKPAAPEPKVEGVDDERKYRLSEFLAWRGVDAPCKECNGSGMKVYGSTATWLGGIGGCAMTNDVCDHCWGTGDEHRHGFNLRAIARREEWE